MSTNINVHIIINKEYTKNVYVDVRNHTVVLDKMSLPITELGYEVDSVIKPIYVAVDWNLHSLDEVSTILCRELESKSSTKGLGKNT